MTAQDEVINIPKNKNKITSVLLLFFLEILLLEAFAHV